MGALLNWGWVRVSGPSMTPTLHDGDRVLVHYDAAVGAGRIVLARFPAGPETLVLKRAIAPVDGGWWLVSDNSRAGSDSRTYGPALPLGVVVRLWPAAPSRPRPSRWRRWLGQSPAPAPPAGL